MHNEVWKTLNKFKNIEDNRYLISSNGEVYDIETDKILHKKIAYKKRHPYYAVHMKYKNGKKEWTLVHQLVAFCFVKIPKKYKGVKDLVPDHLDNNGLNNNYKNLEWKTRSENIKDAFNFGFVDFKCENSPSTIVTNKTVHKICSMLEKGKTYDEILEKVKLPNELSDKNKRKLLIRIKNKLAWTEISDLYNFNSNECKYRKDQLDTISNIKKIKKLISKGYSNREIAREIWGQNCKIKSKEQTVKNIREGKIYKELL